jgi:Fic family protein
MKPYNNTNLPLEFKYDMTLMKHLVEANQLFAKYTTMIEYSNIDNSLLLRPLLFQEAFKSLELSGARISQSQLYYIKYNIDTRHKTELFNYFHVLKNIESYLSKTFKLSVGYLNMMHKDIFKHDDFTYKNVGQYRQKVTWIGPRGKRVYDAEYVPTHPFDIPIAMSNFIKHFNKGTSIDSLIDVALSHAQFENIHPYLDGNGRLGRLLLPIQTYTSTHTPMSLFLSEAIKNNEYSYLQSLKSLRLGDVSTYIKFFLTLVIEQLKLNISRLDDAIKVYNIDQVKFIECSNLKNGEKVFDYFFSNITSTIKEASETLDISYQTMRHYINKLHDQGLLERHKLYRGEYVYTYIKLYNIYVPVDWL